MGDVHARERFQWSIAGVAGAAALAAATATLPLHAQGRGAGGGAGQGGSQAFEETIEKVSADVTIRQWRMTTDDTGGIDPPGLSVRFEAERRGSGWRTSLSATGLDKPSAQLLTGPQALDNPFVVSRLEYDDDGTAPRMYNARGQLMAGPGEKERRALGLPEELRDKTWDPAAILGRVGGAGRGPDRSGVAGLVVGAADGQKRRADLERRFGPKADKVNGRDRFILRQGAAVHEVLVTPDTSLPVEVSSTEGGQLTSHVLFEYESNGGDAIVRRHTRGERSVPNSGGQRMVTDLTIANLTLVRRGGR